ncbi:MAG: LuxR C-terminal-related transcriptional regulator [Cytophagaceae bacterium]|jgi:tetratricopeptide (TPR) repeat protein|nr:LuxR C-terminal-related transcriptional regulator [Cytophagaceae bacterium]
MMIIDIRNRFLTLIILLVVPCAGKSNSLMHRFDSISTQIEQTALYRGAEAKMNLNMLREMADAHADNPSLYIRTLYLEAFLYNVQGITDSTLIPRIKTGIEQHDSPTLSFEKTLLNYTLALSYFNVGNYSDAFATALYALDDFKALGNRKFIVKTFLALGNICASISSDTMAEDYYRQALTFIEPTQTEYYALHSNIYMIWSHTPARRQEAIDSLLNLIPVYRDRNETGLLAVILLNIGACYQSNSEPEKAFLFLKNMLDSIQNVDNRRLLFSLYQNLGNYYVSANNLKNALDYYTLSKNIAAGDRNPAFLSHVTLHLSRLYAELGYEDSAYYYLRQHNSFNSQFYNGAKAIEAYRSYISVFLESSESRLKIAEQDILLQERRFIITLISVFALIILVISLLIVARQRKRYKEAENRDLEMRLQHEHQIQQLQEEKIEAQIREITSYSLLLFNKNQVLQQIADASEHKPKTTADINESYETINRIVKNNLNTDSDWNNFVMHFEKVHPHFFDRLKSCGDTLTETNMRICAYFRIGIAPKEIAQMMNIAPDTVKVTRHRLKKKLGLKEDDSLDDFLRKL